MSHSKFDRSELSQHSYSAYVKAYQNGPDYNGLLDSEMLDFLSFATLRWNSRMGTIVSLLLSGVSFSFLSGARVRDPTGHDIPLNTYIITPAPPGMGKTAAYENILQRAWLELEGELKNAEGNSKIGMLENTTKIGLIDKLGAYNGKVFWCRDELTHHIYTLLTETRGADMHTFRSNLNLLYTSSVFRRDTTKKKVFCDDVHFCIAGTGHPNHCLLLAQALDQEMDGLADRFYIFCARATIDPQVAEIGEKVEELAERYGPIVNTKWAKSIFLMIHRHHEEEQIVYELSAEAADIIKKIKLDNVQQTTQVYERLEEIYGQGNKHTDGEGQTNGDGTYEEIPHNCDSKDIDMIMKCSLIIKALRTGLRVVLGKDENFVLDRTISGEDLMRGWNLVIMLRYHTSCFINSSRALDAVLTKSKIHSDGSVSGLLKGHQLRRGIIMYPGRWMMSTYLSRKYRTGHRSTAFADIFNAFCDLTKKMGESGFIGQYIDLGHKRHAFYKAPWRNCDRQYLIKQYNISEGQYKVMWKKTKTERKISLPTHNWSDCERILKKNIPVDCIDVENPVSDTEEEEYNSGSQGCLPKVTPPKRYSEHPSTSKTNESPTKLLKK